MLPTNMLRGTLQDHITRRHIHHAAFSFESFSGCSSQRPGNIIAGPPGRPWWSRCIENPLKNNALGKTNKSESTVKLLGCTVSELREIFTGMFTRGMTWKKFLTGEIHIDHIRPCVSFDLRKKSEQARCFHYTNLQPLWAKDNWKKGYKIAA